MDIMYFDHASGKSEHPKKSPKPFPPFRMRQRKCQSTEVGGNQGISCGYILPQTQSPRQSSTMYCLCLKKSRPSFFCVQTHTIIHGIFPYMFQILP